jgi:hypothetical protein
MDDSSLQSHSGANLNPKTAKDRSNVPKGGEAGGVALTARLPSLAFDTGLRVAFAYMQDSQKKCSPVGVYSSLTPVTRPLVTSLLAISGAICPIRRWNCSKVSTSAAIFADSDSFETRYMPRPVFWIVPTSFPFRALMTHLPSANVTAKPASSSRPMDIRVYPT